MQLELLSEIEILYNRKQNITNLLNLINNEHKRTIRKFPNDKKKFDGEHEIIYLYCSDDVNSLDILKSNLLKYLNTDTKVTFKYSDKVEENKINIYIAIASTCRIENEILNTKRYKTYRLENDYLPVIIALRAGDPKDPLPKIDNTLIFEINYNVNHDIYENQENKKQNITDLLTDNKIIVDKAKQINLCNFSNVNDKQKTIYLYCSNDVKQLDTLTRNLLEYLNNNDTNINFKYSNETIEKEINIYVEVITTSRVNQQLLETSSYKPYKKGISHNPIVIALRAGTPTDKLPSIINMRMFEINYYILSYNIYIDENQPSRDMLIKYVNSQSTVNL